MKRRHLLLNTAAVTSAALLPSWTQAQKSGTGFPSRPIRLVVPFGAGGVADLTARTVGQKMTEILGQSIVVDNRPGAGGVVAGDTVAKAPPDGYTLLLMSNGTAVSSSLFKTLPFNAEKDFAPISLLGLFDMAIVVSEKSRFKSLDDMLAWAKANPGKLNLGTIQIGSTQNLAAELFKSRAGVDIQVVPFNGTPAVLTALRGDQIDATVEILSPVMPHIHAKALRALAVMGEKRAPALASVPTVAESGGTLAGLHTASWNALAAPAKTPPEVVARLAQAAQKALDTPEVKRQLQSLYVEPRSSTPEPLGQLLSSEITRWAEVISHANIARQ